tara:strand:+ start:450 stop:1694 length:1245 start_codon:yes stop_codon:yes gene_type:complete
MPKFYLEPDVLSAAQDRIKRTFDSFDRIYVSFSGGKDSTVMLHLVMAEAIARGRKVGVMFVDLEGQYEVTIEHSLECFRMYADHIIPLWVCLPINLRNAVSSYSPFWLCWDPECPDDWIRQPPTAPGVVTDSDYFPFFREGMEFEEFVPEFGKWFAQDERCACFVGIRSDESLNRYRTVSPSMNKERLDGLNWTTRVVDEVYNIYPIYDWKTSDIWVYHSKFPEHPYNDLYSLMHQAGLTISQMRICQPYGDDQRRGLWLFHIIEPQTWAKVVARVNGANSGALYVREHGNINGYHKVELPDGHTWESFANVLLDSMPAKSQQHYRVKVAGFCAWWTKRGYPEGIPDAADPVMEAGKQAPSWRRITKTLLRNDFWCKGLSFTQQKSHAYEAYLERKTKQLETLPLEITTNDHPS